MVSNVFPCLYLSMIKTFLHLLLLVIVQNWCLECIRLQYEYNPNDLNDIIFALICMVW